MPAGKRAPAVDGGNAEQGEQGASKCAKMFFRPRPKKVDALRTYPQSQHDNDSDHDDGIHHEHRTNPNASGEADDAQRHVIPRICHSPLPLSPSASLLLSL